MTGSKTAAHAASTLEVWTQLRNLKSGKSSIVLDGNSLDIASIIAVARYGIKPTISTDEDLAKRLQLSVDALAAYISGDWVVYGVNTGFGGSADTRTKDLLDLQISVLQHTQSAIIASTDKDPASNSEREPSHVMRPEWVRGAMLARANQNMRGHSAVRLEVLESLVKLIHHDITPLVPLRGTISASGDLMPMSYIAGAVTGNPDIFVQVGKGKDAKVVPAPVALRESGLAASGLGPKEALGLINGTAPSVSVASIVLYDAQQLVYLAQMLTAFVSESQGGNVEWALPFIHAIRPHAGQIEAASNIRRFLQGSKFVVGLETRKRTGDGLWQDRYSTRTSPQWIGPYLEDLLLAQRQIEVELNSTSDNPLIEAVEKDGKAGGEVYSGGNFQAVVITSAMDKTRLALQMIGRMMFSQVSEIIHPSTNNGLEANLNASERENYTMKGIDVNMAAYMAELAALAHPVSSHVQSAEMHNQGINSLALVSARRTMEAVDLVAHMSACHLYVCCQAVDIRANHKFFFDNLDKALKGAQSPLAGLGLEATKADQLHEKLMPTLRTAWYDNNTNSWKDRITPTVDAAMAPVTQFLATEKAECSISQLATFRDAIEKTVTDTAAAIFYPSKGMSPAEVAMQMGDGTVQLYTWVRSKLGVPTHFGLDDDPLFAAQKGLPTEGKKTIGSWVTMIYESLKGEMMDMVMESLETPRAAPRTADAFEQLCKEMKQMV